MEGYKLEQGRGKMGAKCAGINRHNWLVQNTQVDVKNSIGNEEVKEFICRTHGHELRGDHWRKRGYQVEGDKEEKLGQL